MTKTGIWTCEAEDKCKWLIHQHNQSHGSKKIQKQGKAESKGTKRYKKEEIGSSKDWLGPATENLIQVWV